MEKLKSIFSKKNIIILIVSFVIAIISTINFSVALYANNKTNMTIYLKSGDVINDIKVSNNSLDLRTFASDSITVEDLKNSSDNQYIKKDRLVVNKETTINIDMSIIDDICVEFSNENNFRTYEVAGEIYQSPGNIDYSLSKLHIIKTSLNKTSIFIFIISYIVLFLVIYTINRILNKIKEDKLKLIDIALFLFSIFVVYLSCIYLFMMLNRILTITPAIILSLYILIYFKGNIKEWKNIFLSISVVVGVMMLFTITPGNVPDEPSHYVRGYVDSVAFSSEEKDNAKLPNSINSFFNKFTHNVHSLEIKYSGNSYITELLKEPSYSDLASYKPSYNNTKFLSFLPYVSVIIINFIGRNLEIPVLILFLLCRLGNFIISTILCYYAINTTPRFKKIFALIAMFPIFMQQAVGIDMDYLTNSIAFFFIANIFKYRFDNIKLGIKDLLKIFFIGILLGLCKFGYFPILLLIFLIPNSSFKNKKIAIIFKLLLISLPIIISALANLTAVSNPNTNTEKYTIKTVLGDPVNSAIICTRTFLKRFVSDTFSAQINSFGWSTKYQMEISLWIIAFVYIILLFSDNEDTKCLNIKDRIIMFVVWAIVYLILYGVAFTEWTSIKEKIISGLQSRYFIPILPLFYCIIPNNFLKLNINNKWSFYTISMFIAQIFSCLSILISFY